MRTESSVVVRYHFCCFGGGGGITEISRNKQKFTKNHVHKLFPLSTVGLFLNYEDST